MTSPDDKLKLISDFNSPRLRNSDLAREDIFGDAYKYLLAELAEEIFRANSINACAKKHPSIAA